MKRNSLTVEMLDEASPAEVAALGAASLAALVDMLDEDKRRLDARRSVLEAGMHERWSVPPADFGTHRFDDGEYVVKVELPKRVDWNAEELIAACHKLEDMGENPHEFVTFKPSVSETKFKAVPERFRHILAKARTVKPGKLKISFQRVEAA